MNPPSQNDVRQKHRQLGNQTCSVSALEFVSKLYGITQLDSFPLQTNPANQMKGFDEPNLQSAVGLKGSAAFYDTQSALELIEKETNAGKLPVISLRGFLIGLAPIPVNYHIYVAASEDGQPILIDPADGQVVATTKEDLAKVLEYNSHHNPERSTIHILVLERE